MAWINGQWVDEQQGFGGMLGGFGGQPRFEEGYTGDTSLDVMGGWNPPPLPPIPPNWTQGPPFMPGPQPPFGDRPGMPNLPPQMNPPGYSRGPQMRPPFGGGLGDITPWQPVQPPQWQPQPPQLPTQPPQVYPPIDIPGLRPAGIRPDPVGVNLGPQPPQFPSLPPQMTFDPPMPPIPPRPPVRPPIVDPILPPPPKRDTGAEERARRLAAQKRAAANQRAATLQRQKARAALQRSKDLAEQKAAAAAKRARDKAEATRQRAVSKRKPSREKPTPPPVTRRTDVDKGPKSVKNITGIARSQRGRGDR